MAVELSESKENGVVVLRVDGRLDAASAPLLERKISSMADAGQNKLVLAMEGVEFLSSAGMRLLLTTSKRMSSDGGKLVLAAVADEVMEVVRMAGFDRIIPICATEREAIASFS